MHKTNCFKYCDKQSNILIITLQSLYTQPIVDNKYEINDNLELPPFSLEKSSNDFSYDFLFLRDPYSIYYLGGSNLIDTCDTYYTFIDIINEIIKKKNL